MDELEPCPHCGKSVSELADCVELEDCACFESCAEELFSCVVCNVSKGGCGASGGYAPTKKEAIEKWNRRASSGNKPLTVEQVKQLNSGALVTIVEDGEIKSHEKMDFNIGADFWGYGDIEDGTIKVYARKPEQEE